MLQRMAEHYQYVDLYKKAAKEQDPILRLAYIAAFVVAGFSTNPLRVTKYFNPVIGETFEFIDNELEFRYFGEQVSLQPEVCAFYVEGEGFNLHGNTNTSSVFSMNSIEFTPIGRTFIKLLDFGDEISYTQPSAVVRNIIYGAMHIDTAGNSEITNHTTGDSIELKFYDEGKPKSTDVGIVEGFIKDLDGEIKAKLKGNRTTHFDLIYNNTTITLWKANTTKESEDIQDKKYFFSEYAINLNNDNEAFLRSLPKTDCRLRKDMRLLEKQMFDESEKEREKILSKQNKVLDELKKQKKIYKPVYFLESYDDVTGELVYNYSRDYWKDKSENNFSHLADIY